MASCNVLFVILGLYRGSSTLVENHTGNIRCNIRSSTRPMKVILGAMSAHETNIMGQCQIGKKRSK